MSRDKELFEELGELYKDIPMTTIKSAARNLEKAMKAKTTSGQLNYAIDSFFHSLAQYSGQKQEQIVRWLAVSGDIIGHILNENMFRNGGVQWSKILDKLWEKLLKEVKNNLIPLE